MSARPGDRQLLDNAAHKLHLGSTPNGVANQFLSMCRAKHVTVRSEGGCHEGTLLAFDAYSMLIARDGDHLHVLIFKGPGVSVEIASGDLAE